MIPRLFRTVKAIGLESVLYRAWYIFQQKTGILKSRFPSTDLSNINLLGKLKNEHETNLSARDLWQACSNRFFFRPKDCQYMRAWLCENVPDAQFDSPDQFGEDNLRLFFKWNANLGDPTNFNYDPRSHQNWPVPRHWTTFSQFDPKLSDIKMVWEASRFSYTYVLARSFAQDPQDAFKNRIWTQIESWIKQNPLEMSVGWACSQEISIRLMAWLFAVNVVGIVGHEGLSDRLLRIIWYSAEHIQKNIRFSLSLKNNHGITEAVGLYTVGTLFPEFKQSEKWKQLGKKFLVQEGIRQIYSDGSYIQNSMNYHRLMLHDYLWAVRLGQINDDAFPTALLDKLRLAMEFICQMVDLKSGRVPNYGANDGALILPLNSCDYLDYRPVLQAMSVLLNGERLFEPGPWDEDLLWLFGPEALHTPMKLKSPRSSAFKDGGYYTFRGGKSWGMIRCHTYRDRPSQADMLHFDLWYEGQNLLRDTGTFQYYCGVPWNHYFKSTAAHNTVEVDGKDQMKKGPRFLWFNWTKSKLRHNQRLPQLDSDYWEAEHHGYCDGKDTIVHRRAVVRLGDRWIIIDDILGTGEHSVVLRWHLADVGWEISTPGVFVARDVNATISVRSPSPIKASTELFRGQETPRPEGWESLYYGDRQPIPVIRRQAGGSLLPLRFVTTIHFDETTTWRISPNQITMNEGYHRVQLNQPMFESGRIITNL